MKEWTRHVFISTPLISFFHLTANLKISDHLCIEAHGYIKQMLYGILII